MGFEFKLTVNSDLLKNALREQIITALEAVGIQAEGDVKDKITELKAVDTGRLRQSISHKVVSNEKAVYIGSNARYARYVHDGTGAENVAGGTLEKRWVYKDDLTGEWRIGVPQKPRRFLRDAIQANIKDYEEIIEEYLKK